MLTSDLQPSITAEELLSNPDSTTPKWKRVLIVISSIMLDAIVPLAFYFILRTFMDPMWALLVSGAPALLIFIVRMVWKRDVSVVALMTFVAFVVSSVAAIATDDPRILLLEKSLIMGVIGIVHVATLVPFPTVNVKLQKLPLSIIFSRGQPIKPFLFYIAKQFFPMGNMNPLYIDEIVVEKYTWLWSNIPVFRLHLRIVTGVLGVSLVIEFFVKVVMIFSSLTVDQVMLYSNIVFVIVMSLSFAFCALYIFFAKKSFYKHVDEWISNHHMPSPTFQVIVKSEESPLL